jgi:hypothetical protein
MIVGSVGHGGTSAGASGSSACDPECVFAKAKRTPVR